ncbi:hypothetical protein FRC03_012444 [Tulasnella sp. 419]|nr:hypothetical protein FRC03_012444 [Tulasnella sp. 419]
MEQPLYDTHGPSSPSSHVGRYPLHHAHYAASADSHPVSWPYDPRTVTPPNDEPLNRDAPRSPLHSPPTPVVTSPTSGSGPARPPQEYRPHMSPAIAAPSSFTDAHNSGGTMMRLPSASPSIASGGSPPPEDLPHKSTSDGTRDSSLSRRQSIDGYIPPSSPPASAPPQTISYQPSPAPFSGYLHPPSPSIPPPTSSTTRRPIQKTKTKLTDMDRKFICVFAENNPKARQEDIATKFQVERSTVSKILKCKDKWMKVDFFSSEARVVKHRPSKFPEIEEELILLIRQRVANRETVNDAFIKKSALELAHARGIGKDKFKASSGWVENFKHRHDIRKGGSWKTSAVSSSWSASSPAVSAAPLSADGDIEDPTMDHDQELRSTSGSIVSGHLASYDTNYVDAMHHARHMEVANVQSPQPLDYPSGHGEAAVSDNAVSDSVHSTSNPHSRQPSISMYPATSQSPMSEYFDASAGGYPTPHRPGHPGVSRHPSFPGEHNSVQPETMSNLAAAAGGYRNSLPMNGTSSPPLPLQSITSNPYPQASPPHHQQYHPSPPRAEMSRSNSTSTASGSGMFSIMHSPLVGTTHHRRSTSSTSLQHQQADEISHMNGGRGVSPNPMTRTASNHGLNRRSITFSSFSAAGNELQGASNPGPRMDDASSPENASGAHHGRRSSQAGFNGAIPHQRQESQHFYHSQPYQNGNGGNSTGGMGVGSNGYSDEDYLMLQAHAQAGAGGSDSASSNGLPQTPGSANGTRAMGIDLLDVPQQSSPTSEFVAIPGLIRYEHPGHANGGHLPLGHGEAVNGNGMDVSVMLGVPGPYEDTSNEFRHEQQFGRMKEMMHHQHHRGEEGTLEQETVR